MIGIGTGMLMNCKNITNKLIFLGIGGLLFSIGTFVKYMIPFWIIFIIMMIGFTIIFEKIEDLTKQIKDENKNDVVSVANGGIVVDFTARIVYRDGERIEMSPKEYDLFFYMIKNKNIALTRDKLLSDVWGYDFFGDDRTLDTHIKILRKSLGKYSDLIVTIRGVGYRFEDKYE
jgi:DNA-binding winged helix-turn-helix (wHTH) protein